MTIEQSPSRSFKPWNVSLWVVQILLAAFFGSVGLYKLTAPIPELANAFIWPGDVSELLVRFIGACELAAALGLVLPSMTRVLPVLTPLAAEGLVLVMCLAMGFHAFRGEYSAIPINLLIGALAGFVAWGRSSVAPITPR